MYPGWLGNRSDPRSRMTFCPGCTVTFWQKVMCLTPSYCTCGVAPGLSWIGGAGTVLPAWSRQVAAFASVDATQSTPTAHRSAATRLRTTGIRDVLRGAGAGQAETRYLPWPRVRAGPAMEARYHAIRQALRPRRRTAGSAVEHVGAAGGGAVRIEKGVAVLVLVGDSEGSRGDRHLGVAVLAALGARHAHAARRRRPGRRRLEERIRDRLAAAGGTRHFIDLLPERRRRDRADDEVPVRGGRRGRVRSVSGRDVTLKGPVADHIRERGMSIRGQEHEVLDVGVLQLMEQPDALGRVALPAIVGQGIELLNRRLVHDDLPVRCRTLDGVEEPGQLRPAEERVVPAVDRVLTGLRDRIGEGRNDRGEEVAGALRRGWRQVRLASVRVVALVVRR